MLQCIRWSGASGFLEEVHATVRRDENTGARQNSTAHRPLPVDRARYNYIYKMNSKAVQAVTNLLAEDSFVTHHHCMVFLIPHHSMHDSDK